MRIRLCLLAITVLLAWGVWTPAIMAETNVDLTGRQWQESSRKEKLAFLYGASSIVAIENMIAEKAGREPSVFVRGWLTAFKDTSWTEIESKLDTWYATHPNQQERHVLEILWKEFLAPSLNK